MLRGIKSCKMLRIKSFIFIFCLLVLPLLAENIPPTTTLCIPMRDGAQLQADVYLPSPDAKGLPCILIRNPAGRKAPSWLHYANLCKLGYAVVIQDTRSASDLEGKTFPFFDDGWGDRKDGYDTVEWLAKHPLTNGKIGTLGFSACGITQLLLAPSHPPSLKCQYIGQAAGNLFKHAIFPGGKWMKDQVEGWLALYAKHPEVVQYANSQPYYNNFWSKFDTIQVASQVQAPGFFYVGWYDTFLQGTIDSFLARQNNGGKGAKGKQKLIIGPWTHFWPMVKTLGDYHVPKDGYAPPFDMSPQRWFDYYLKDAANGVDKIPPVSYYVMGPFDGSPSKGNRWKTAEQWPVPSQEKALFLSSEDKLSWQLEKDSAELTYRYDSDHPSPTIGGHNLFLESGPKDQRPIEQRDDVLVFTTEPLAEDLEVTGHLYAHLYFASDHTDTDLAVRLTDVYPDGKSLLIADGILSSRSLNESRQKQPPHEYRIDLASTSIVFGKGHRIRVSITNSNYPRFDKSKERCLSLNKLLFGGKYPSRLILPIIQE